LPLRKLTLPESFPRRTEKPKSAAATGIANVNASPKARIIEKLRIYTSGPRRCDHRAFPLIWCILRQMPNHDGKRSPPPQKEMQALRKGEFRRMRLGNRGLPCNVWRLQQLEVPPWLLTRRRSILPESAAIRR
jgi:hypothetical protein